MSSEKTNRMMSLLDQLDHTAWRLGPVDPETLARDSGFISGLRHRQVLEVEYQEMMRLLREIRDRMTKEDYVTVVPQVFSLPYFVAIWRSICQQMGYPSIDYGKKEDEIRRIVDQIVRKFDRNGANAHNNGEDVFNP